MLAAGWRAGPARGSRVKIRRLRPACSLCRYPIHWVPLRRGRDGGL